MFVGTLRRFVPHATNRSAGGFGLSQQVLTKYASSSSLRRRPSPLTTTTAVEQEEEGMWGSMASGDERQEPETTSVVNAVGRDEVAAGKKRTESEWTVQQASQQDVERKGRKVHHANSSHSPWQKKLHVAVDPSEVVTFNSETKELHLTKMQRHALWEARRKEYQQVLVRIAVTLQGHLSSESKCHALLLIHEELVVKRRLRLRQDTYDDIFHVISAVATNKENRENSRLTVPYLNEVWVLYRYMIDSGTDPSAKIVQFVMSVLELVRAKNVDVEARAHSMLLDCDARSICPTDFTLHSYFNICGVNNVMHIAMSRLHEVRMKHQVQPTASMCSMMLHGLMANGQVKEAVRFVSTLDSVGLTEPLLNNVLHVMRKSGDPLSVFTAYRAVRSSQVPITKVTIHIMLQAMADANNFSELSFVLKEMKRFAIRGDVKLLNNLLGMLLKSGRKEEYEALLQTMRRQRVLVFDECLVEPVPTKTIGGPSRTLTG